MYIIYIRFGDTLYRQIDGIPIGTNGASFFLFINERNFMISFSDDKQTDNIEVFNSNSRYLDDLHDINNPFFEGIGNQIYPPELQVNKTNASDRAAPFLD